jgi:histidine phosphotransferase ChpT
MPAVQLDPLDLAALLCSKVCHDVISPVGAIVNGLELLEEERDAEMRAEALKLVQRSAKTASAKLQFCRLAFGAAGSAGASIDTGDAEQVARSLLADERTKVEWNAARLLLPKNKVKLLLNMCLIAAAAIPRGGVIKVSIAGEGETTALEVASTGSHVRLASNITSLLAGAPEGGTVDAHGIQAYYTGLVAQATNMSIGIESTPEGVTIEAKPIPPTES